MGTDLSVVPTREEVATLERIATIIAKSGLITDAKQASQAFTKMVYGRDLGLSPTQALAGLHIIDGKPELSSTLKAALIREHGWDYRADVREDGATVRIINPSGEVIGEAGFSEDDAKLAGLLGKGAWKKYPSDMYFARAMSRAVRRYCPHVLNGIPTYAHGELADERGEAPPELPAESDVADVIEGTAEPEPEPESLDAPGSVATITDVYREAGLGQTDDADPLLAAARFLRETTVEAAVAAEKDTDLLLLAEAYQQGAGAVPTDDPDPIVFRDVLRGVQEAHKGGSYRDRVQAAVKALSDPIPF